MWILKDIMVGWVRSRLWARLHSVSVPNEFRWFAVGIIYIAKDPALRRAGLYTCWSVVTLIDSVDTESALLNRADLELFVGLFLIGR